MHRQIHPAECIRHRPKINPKRPSQNTSQHQIKKSADSKTIAGMPRKKAVSFFRSDDSKIRYQLLIMQRTKPLHQFLCPCGHESSEQKCQRKTNQNPFYLSFRKISKYQKKNQHIKRNPVPCIRNGQPSVFNSPKYACFKCFILNYLFKIIFFLFSKYK